MIDYIYIIYGDIKKYNIYDVMRFHSGHTACVEEHTYSYIRKRNSTYGHAPYTIR